ncbi:DUF222 domain-containing protein [Amycolatopsis minnesotensis]|uniref:DUF222 domain-containing protein n=1 Tax=Amycolatopsis minnesotensis TaxID=337894 RepID=UPI003CD09357
MVRVSSRRSVAGEIALLSNLTQAAAERKVALAVALTSYLPCTLAAMEAGLINEYAASRVFEATACVSEGVAAEVDSLLAGRFENRNPPALRRLVNSLLMRVDPEGYERRRQEKMAARRRSPGRSAAGRGEPGCGSAAARRSAPALRRRRTATASPPTGCGRRR